MACSLDGAAFLPLTLHHALVYAAEYVVTIGRYRAHGNAVAKRHEGGFGCAMLNDFDAA